MAALLDAGQVPLRYATASGGIATSFPEDPNGSELGAAAVCNAAGNVLAMMPHPERALELGQVCRGIPGEWATRREGACEAGTAAEEPGPGLLFFEGLRRHLEGA
jgi:phosphoribosylformylglycinamidine (FGAM) synthase-like amidotransferase family enzyme